MKDKFRCTKVAPQIPISYPAPEAQNLSRLRLNSPPLSCMRRITAHKSSRCEPPAPAPENTIFQTLFTGGILPSSGNLRYGNPLDWRGFRRTGGIRAFLEMLCLRGSRFVGFGFGACGLFFRCPNAPGAFLEML